MKSGRFSFGLFILTIGVAWFANTAGWQPDGWSSFLPYWPVLLILWGLSIMIRQEMLRGVVLAVAAVFAGLWVVSWFDPGVAAQPSDRQELSLPSDSDVRTGTLRFDSGAGKFTIKDSSAGGNLLNVAGVVTRGSYQISQEISGSNLSARVWYDQQWGQPMLSLGGGWRNEVTLSLHQDVNWTLDVNVGAADFTLDAADLLIEQATISAGAADINVRLGDLAKYAFLTVKAGASDINIQVPREVGVRAELSTGLTGRSLADLVKESDKVWASPDYDTAARQIEIRFETGVSNIELERY